MSHNATRGSGVSHNGVLSDTEFDLLVYDLRFADDVNDDELEQKLAQHDDALRDELKAERKHADKLAEQLRNVLDDVAGWNSDVERIIGRAPDAGIRTTAAYQALAAYEARRKEPLP